MAREENAYRAERNVTFRLHNGTAAAGISARAWADRDFGR
jgi:hypothetical protein